MTTVKMAKGKFVTHVYNDPKTIADAKKKGFSLIDAKPAGAEPGNETAQEPQDQTDSNSEGNQ